MILIKENKSKKRSVFYDGNYYYKTWHFLDIKWLENHVKLLSVYAPEILDEYSCTNNSMTLKMKEIKGTLVSSIIHSQELFNAVYSACQTNIENTYPYAHGDWVLSNMIITDQKEIKFVDWDNLSLSSKENSLLKMHKDLKSAFESKFKKFLYDSSSI